MIATDPQIEQLIHAIDAADSPAKLVSAVRTLAQTRSLHSIPTLIKALGFNNPGAALAAVSGLVALGEVAVPSLLEQIDGYNYGARAYSLRALAAIADPRALEELLQAAVSDFAPSVRRAAIKGLGHLRWQSLDPDRRQPAQAQTLHILLLVSQDPDWAIRYAAVVGLQGWITAAHSLSVGQDLIAQALERLEVLVQSDSDAAVKARSQVALSQLQELLSRNSSHPHSI